MQRPRHTPIASTAGPASGTVNGGETTTELETPGELQDMADTPTRWLPIGSGHWVGSDTSTRFPTYTRGNAGEVYPEVFTPLTYSLAGELGERCMRAALGDTGLLTDAELDAPVTTSIGSGVFGGYAYLNLSVQRLIAERVPGGSAADADANYLGVGTEIPPPDADLPKNLVASLRGLRYLWRTVRLANLPPLEQDRARTDAFLAAQVDPAQLSDIELRAEVTDHLDLIEDLFRHHLIISGQAGICVSALSAVLEQNLGSREAVGEILAGIGDVDSAAPSFELWDLGRMVAADPTLTALFDDPTPDRMGRLRDTAAPTFLAAFDAFLERHGARGPNEWDTAFDTWGTDPELALSLIDRMRLTDGSMDPRQRASALTARREQRTAEVRAGLPRPVRRIFDRLLHAAHVTSRSRERAKTTVVQAIHVSRVRGKELDRRLNARRDGTPGDLWFLVAEELDAYVADPTSMNAVIAERREMHARLAERIPPFTFTGEMPPLDTWERRDVVRDQLEPGQSIDGLPGCPGVATGRARVVTDPGDPGALGPGDVLVAPLTDPSWTPLFLAASAVVVDVGAIMSHAVIVSRELGIPCVVSATDATRRIPDGTMIEVDGTKGSIRLLDERGPA